MRILIVGMRGDPHLDAVLWGTRELGHQATVWYWSDFPKNDLGFVRLGDRDPSFGIHLNGCVYSDPFDVIWVRRRGDPTPMDGTHPDDQSIVHLQSSIFFDNILPLLGHAGTRWINHPEADYRCRNKAFQLLTAKANGFRIPETIIGNHIQQVRGFFTERQENVIHKAFTHLRWDNPDGSRTTGRTSVIKGAHLENEFAVRACPGIYQEKLEKRYELRVTVMGEKVVAAAIDSQRDGPTVDWRCEGGRGSTNLAATTIDDVLAERCRVLCRAIGLSFGCIDLIVTPDDEVVFLEINCAGQFLFNEIADPRLPMLDTFCRYLIHGENAPVGDGQAALRFADYRDAAERSDPGRMLDARY